MRAFSILVDDDSAVHQLLEKLDSKFVECELKPQDKLILNEAKKCIGDYSESAKKFKKIGGSINSSRSFKTSVADFTVKLVYPKPSALSKLTHKVLGNL